MEIWRLVEKKNLSQWFLKTSDYSEELLSDLDSLDMWPQKVKTMQSNWIGKSEGAEISFSITGNNILKQNFIKVYTTRPDTIFGATFIAISHLSMNFQKKFLKKTMMQKNLVIRSKKLTQKKQRLGTILTFLFNILF